MADAERIDPLVRDALTQRFLEGHGCFWSDKSCRLLQERGPAVLPSIEDVVNNDVLPLYHYPADSLRDKFPGLLGLFVTYFRVAKEAGDDRTYVFFQRLCGSVRVTAMSALNIVWLSRGSSESLP